ncbi:MAG TPA: ferritin-like domain-containing protein [Verrucomicrobiae bacterium]|nr:ferritin-like domain-containing protein [Verrucomicrobiae bacterium]
MKGNERILFLEGIPNLSAYDRITVGSGVKQQFENDLGLELAALTVLRPGIKTCIEASDDGTRKLLEHIVVDEEKHVDWLETQLHPLLHPRTRGRKEVGAPPQCALLTFVSLVLFVANYVFGITESH